MTGPSFNLSILLILQDHLEITPQSRFTIVPANRVITISSPLLKGVENFEKQTNKQRSLNKEIKQKTPSNKLDNSVGKIMKLHLSFT